MTDTLLACLSKFADNNLGAIMVVTSNYMELVLLDCCGCRDQVGRDKDGKLYILNDKDQGKYELEEQVICRKNYPITCGWLEEKCGIPKYGGYATREGISKLSQLFNTSFNIYKERYPESNVWDIRKERFNEVMNSSIEIIDAWEKHC